MFNVTVNGKKGKEIKGYESDFIKKDCLSSTDSELLNYITKIYIFKLKLQSKSTTRLVRYNSGGIGISPNGVISETYVQRSCLDRIEAYILYRILFSFKVFKEKIDTN